MELEFKEHSIGLNGMEYHFPFNLFEPMQDYQSYSHLLGELIDLLYSEDVNLVSLGFYPYPIFLEKKLSKEHCGFVFNILEHHCNIARNLPTNLKKKWMFDEFLKGCLMLIDQDNAFITIQESKSESLFHRIRFENLGDYDLLFLLKEYSNNYDLELLRSLKLDLSRYLFFEKDKLESTFSSSDIEEAIQRRINDNLIIPYIKTKPIQDLTEKQKEYREKFKIEPNNLIDLEVLLFPYEFYSLRKFGTMILNKIRELMDNETSKDQSEIKVNSGELILMENKHPNIFTDKGYFLWNRLVENFQIKDSSQTDVKFCFEKMKKDSFIHNSVSQSYFLKFLAEHYGLLINKPNSSCNLNDPKRIHIYDLSLASLG